MSERVKNGAEPHNKCKEAVRLRTSSVAAGDSAGTFAGTLVSFSPPSVCNSEPTKEIN